MSTCAPAKARPLVHRVAAVCTDRWSPGFERVGETLFRSPQDAPSVTVRARTRNEAIGLGTFAGNARVNQKGELSQNNVRIHIFIFLIPLSVSLSLFLPLPLSLSLSLSLSPSRSFSLCLYP